jgi:hypothetical protein
MGDAPLLPSNVASIPQAQGIYVLFLRGQVVYIGKTDAVAGLRNRLERHAFRIQHRRNLNPTEVTFKAIRVFVFTAMDLEGQLIHHFQTGDSLPWNSSGFGSNDPGRKRDTTKLKEGGFDSVYPINVDHPVHLELPSKSAIQDVIGALKRALPYTFRVDGGRALHSDFEGKIAILPGEPFTTRQVVTSIVQALPVGWQATVLPGRIILYKESREYESGTVIARS